MSSSWLPSNFVLIYFSWSSTFKILLSYYSYISEFLLIFALNRVLLFEEDCAQIVKLGLEVHQILFVQCFIGLIQHPVMLFNIRQLQPHKRVKLRHIHHLCCHLPPFLLCPDCLWAAIGFSLWHLLIWWIYSECVLPWFCCSSNS